MVCTSVGYSNYSYPCRKEVRREARGLLSARARMLEEGARARLKEPVEPPSPRTPSPAESNKKLSDVPNFVIGIPLDTTPRNDSTTCWSVSPK